MPSKREIIFYVAAMTAVLIYGTVGSYILGGSGNFNVNINTPIEALYFTVVTISTVGYGDITPVTGVGRIFVIILIISGLSIFLSAITLLSGELFSSRVESLYAGAYRVDKKTLNRHIVLVGYDTTNAIVAAKLKKQKRNFIIITGDKPTVDNLRENGYNAYIADYTLKQDMEKFALDRATDVVVDLQDSSKTVYVVLTVKRLAKDVKISVVVQNDEIEAHLSDLDIDSIINPATIAANQLTEVLDRDQDAVDKKGTNSK